MLDMNEDEPMDPGAAEQWGTASTLECFLKFAQKAVQFIPEELKKPQPLDSLPSVVGSETPDSK
jgi:hypothetical protein